MNDSHVSIFDTTLRDGEQSPGARMSVADKVVIARMLDEMRVDVIEAGFAASSQMATKAMRAISEVVRHSIVLSLARANRADIECAVASVDEAVNPGVHVFIATSDLHLDKKLQMTRAEVLDRVGQMVTLARSYCSYVQFSAEDASRSDPNFLRQVFTEAIRCGATTINVPDTTGCAWPDTYGKLFAYLREHTSGGYNVRWSTHCHNDVGMAVANSLSAVQNGARQIECTINGIGERAGNTDMATVVAALLTHHEKCGLGVNVDTTAFVAASNSLQAITGLCVPRNQPVVGLNAFAHEAGIHQDGMSVDPQTYEIMDPERFGQVSRLVLGDHSGRAGLKARLNNIGIEVSDTELVRLLGIIKNTHDKGVDIDDKALRALVANTTPGH